MPQIPVPRYPEDFGGYQGEELVNEDWLYIYRNYLEEHFAQGDNLEGHHDPRIVVAFRNSRNPDSFNDLVGGYNITSGELRLWRATADPGKDPMQRISKLGVHPDGVARLQAGMTRNCFKYGFHHNHRSHPAMRQCAVIPFERFDTEEQAWYTPEKQTIRGFNVHRSKFHGKARWVGDWSHGCLVFPDRHEHWRYLLWMGYPKNGPHRAPIAVRNRRHSVVVIDITHTLPEKSL